MVAIGEKNSSQEDSQVSSILRGNHILIRVSQQKEHSGQIWK